MVLIWFLLMLDQLIEPSEYHLGIQMILDIILFFYHSNTRHSGPVFKALLENQSQNSQILGVPYLHGHCILESHSLSDRKTSEVKIERCY
jgi:hypothetical protein